MTCLGIGLLVVPAVSPFVSSWAREGLGTALLLVAASILFVAVIEVLPEIGKKRDCCCCQQFDCHIRICRNYSCIGGRKFFADGRNSYCHHICYRDRNSNCLGGQVIPRNL